MLVFAIALIAWHKLNASNFRPVNSCPNRHVLAESPAAKGLEAYIAELSGTAVGPTPFMVMK